MKQSIKFPLAAVATAIMLLVAIVHCFPAHAQSNSQSQAQLPCQSEADAFWKLWEGNKPSEAVRRSAPNADAERAWDAIARSADAFQNKSGGKCLGHSEIIRKSLGDRLEYVSFLALYDQGPMRVQMLYYRPLDRWKLLNLRIDSDSARWMDEALALPSSSSGETRNIESTPADQ